MKKLFYCPLVQRPWLFRISSFENFSICIVENDCLPFRNFLYYISTRKYQTKFISTRSLYSTFSLLKIESKCD